MALSVFFASVAVVNAQTQKDWYMIGANISDIALGLQKDNNTFKFKVSPKIAWFIKDNLAVGGEVGLGLTTSKTTTQFDYTIGPLARYYFKGNGLNSVSKTRWFAEANVGFQGSNIKTKGFDGVSTNGIGFGIGPGLAYFINQNIALEALAKWNMTAGFGNSTTFNSINIGVGMQIYLPKAKIQSMKQDVK